ncbi:MAG: peptide ABC transporter substrate-binding protein [Opitutae bacterium]|nr:peptide ABC transporter substrate-binding protein [Opitutae bacterium]
MVLRALLEGLTVPTPAGGVQPAVAEKWETSADGLRWTFHLRRDAHWTNGTLVTAQDFAYTIRRALTPALAAPKAPLFFVLKNAESFYRGAATDFAQVGVAAPDDHTLVLTLDHPSPHLPALLASGPWLPVPAEVVEKFGNTRESAWSRPGNFVGNGPFALVEWRERQHLLVRRNPAYRQFGRVRLDGIRFQIYDSGETEERAYRAGQVDITMSVPFSKLASYTPPQLQAQPLAETRYLALNVARPPLDHPLVRRALALAIDRQALIDGVLKGAQTPALSFIPPGLDNYTPAERLTPDAAKARELLAEAGFPGGRGFPKLEIAGWTASPAALEAIQQMWRRELGIETSLVQREAKVHLAALHAGDYAIALVPLIPDYGDPAAAFGELQSGAAGNYPHWRNARYDALIEEAGRTPDAAQRLALYREAEALVLAELPVIPLYFNSLNYLLSPRVRGWRSDPLWNRYYLDLALPE